MARNWVCPHCSIVQSVVSEKQQSYAVSIGLKDQREGDLVLRHSSIGCANTACRKSTIHVTVGQGSYDHSRGDYSFKAGVEPIFAQFVYPQGTAKPQPAYIPEALIEDYNEACLIRDLSPKAAATLIRRCLQGMIRDFAGISQSRLIDEVKALKAAVEDGSADRSISIESVDAIDAVRSIGNLGAHMERNINEIVEVESGEAQALIELVEMLFEEWYGARQKRQERLAGIQAIKASKDAVKSANKLAAPNHGSSSVVNALLGTFDGEVAAVNADKSSP